MRNVSWGNRKVRQDLANVFDLYVRLYESTLRDDPKWIEAKKSFVSDGMLEKLYCGFESSDDTSWQDWLEVHATSFSAWREQIEDI